MLGKMNSCYKDNWSLEKPIQEQGEIYSCCILHLNLNQRHHQRTWLLIGPKAS